MKTKLGTYVYILPAAVLLCLALIAGSGCAFKRIADPGPEADTGPLGVIINIYQGPLDHLSAVRTGRCSMYPSCSHYAQAAAEKHGPLVGAMLASDRLIRCGRSELDYAPKIPVNGKWRYYDPLYANDFWFSGNNDPGSPGRPTR
ncbi:MAG: membrane protein insertion efficiency factor YidD [Desulfosalsimonas sp.]